MGSGFGSEVSLRELEILCSVSAEEWEEAAAVCEAFPCSLDELEALVAKGLLICDSTDPDSILARSREEAFRGSNWSIEAAIYHQSTRHLLSTYRREPREVRLDKQEREFGKFVDRYGVPPAAFPEFSSGRGIELPRMEVEGDFWKVLYGRTTSRTYGPDATLALEDLAALLFNVFGCRETTRLAPDVELQRRTSPSGGGLHPIEAFPFVTRVEGLAPGLYHYRSRENSLALLDDQPVEQHADYASEICLGQEWAASAPLLVFLVARFERSFWKYRRNNRAYTVVMLDAGHLSQTFYLVAERLGLGAVFSAALDLERVDRSLGVDGSRVGTVGVCACGPKLAEDPLRLWEKAY